MSPIQGLWVEGPLSPMEELSIRSFLAHGHEYHLYGYGEIPNVPAGARLLPAEGVLPPEEVFRLRVGTRSYSPFSNVFRYKLLADRGGWWADLDMVCLRPLDFDDEWVFASERLPEGGSLGTTGILKAPPGSLLLAECFERARRQDGRDLEWGVIGPRFLDEAIRRHGMTRYVRSPGVFCPIDWWRAGELRQAMALPEAAFTVHLWNEIWRANGWPKEPGDPPASLYDFFHALYRPEGGTLSSYGSGIRNQPARGQEV